MKPKRPVTRFGGAEYELPAPSLSLYEMRGRFFDAVIELAPEVLSSLRDIHQKLCAEPERWHAPAVPSELRAWGGRWRLTDDWCYELARERFAGWEAEERGNPENMEIKAETHSLAALLSRIRAKAGGRIKFGITKRSDPDSDQPHEVIFDGSVGPLQLSIRGWDLFIGESEAAFREGAIRQFHEELNAYVERNKQAALTAGARPTSTKRNLDHFYWLAGYQVLGWSAGKIAGGPCPMVGAETEKRRGVEQRIKELAQQIGLTLRARSDYDRTVTHEIVCAALKRRRFAPAHSRTAR